MVPVLRQGREHQAILAPPTIIPKTESQIQGQPALREPSRKSAEGIEPPTTAYPSRRRSISCRTNGLLSRSTEILVSFMWPGRTTVSSGSCNMRSMMLEISV